MSNPQRILGDQKHEKDLAGFYVKWFQRIQKNISQVGSFPHGRGESRKSFETTS